MKRVPLMKTPEQIAESTVPFDGGKLTDRAPLTWEEVQALIVEGIEADRKQRGEKLYREALDKVKVIKEFREKREAEYTCFKKTGELD